MSGGAIPIVQKHGVALELIHHGKHGFLASSINDYYEFSLRVLHMQPNDIAQMRKYATARASHFERWSYFVRCEKGRQRREAGGKREP